MQPGDVVSYLEMCSAEGENLQRGMNFRTDGRPSVLLMSLRAGAPYDDRIEEDGRVLIYEGHDAPRLMGGPDPKGLDQPLKTPFRSLSQNGLFFRAARDHFEGGRPAARVRVYEKIKAGIWAFSGSFRLVNAWMETSGSRNVAKFRLELDEDPSEPVGTPSAHYHEPSRLIPSSVKLEVWKRDGGKCTKCGSTQDLHFDHIIPFSKGGSSRDAKNVQLLCAKHNLEKHDQLD
jgi:hypothetical protein